MEAEINARSIGVPADGDINVFTKRFPVEQYFVMVDDALRQDDAIPDSSIHFEGDMSDAFESGSPEHMGLWMSERLRRRIWSRVVKGGDLKHYMMMIGLLEGLVKKCSQSELNRRRCMHMMLNIDDLSSHESSDCEDKTYLDEFLEGIPTDDNLACVETFGSEGYEENFDRDLGP